MRCLVLTWIFVSTLACTANNDTTAAASTHASGGGPPPTCTTCIKDADCGQGKCAQFGGDSYCAADCSTGQGCATGTACTTVNSAEGNQVQVCVPITDACGSSATTGSGGAGSVISTGSGETCGSLLGPDVTSCCSSCKSAGKPCQANGCYGGWWCNAPACSCQPPPADCGSSGTGGSGGGTGGSVTSISGGKLDTLNFAVVGDTRPPTEDDTAAYPTAVIGQIWKDIQAIRPPPAFGISTGDYMFANPYGAQGAAQLDVYLAARAAYTNGVFPAMGNHECTGGTASNCGPGTQDGETNNYKAFMSKMLGPLGLTQPYYEVDVAATSNAWTAKFLFVAANAWTGTQASWLQSALTAPTTYTFVVRHEGNLATTAPGVNPSNQIIQQHPLTLLIVGHTHTFEYFASDHEVIVGNGGAPLSGSTNYGYVVARQRADGAIALTAYDYATNGVMKTFAVKADGTAAP